MAFSSRLSMRKGEHEELETISRAEARAPVSWDGAGLLSAARKEDKVAHEGLFTAAFEQEHEQPAAEHETPSLDLLCKSAACLWPCGHHAHPRADKPLFTATAIGIEKFAEHGCAACSLLAQIAPDECACREFNLAAHEWSDVKVSFADALASVVEWRSTCGTARIEVCRAQRKHTASLRIGRETEKTQGGRRCHFHIDSSKTSTSIACPASAFKW